VNLSIEIDGQKEFDHAVDLFNERIADWREAWPEIEQVFYRIELEQFNTEGSRGGGRWVPLSPAYKKWKEVRYPGKPILHLTGRLKRSLSVLGGEDSIRDAQPDSLTLGTKVPYAGYHQRGTSKMPARPPLELTRDDFTKIASRLIRFSERGARDAGFGVKSKRLPTAKEGFS
jgi:phage gpG-like protein